MKKEVIVMNKEIERCINVIADNIKEKAKDISNDLKNVLSIEIKAKIENGTILNFEVIKNYGCCDYVGKGNNNE